MINQNYQKYMKNKIVYVNSSIVDKINNISDLSDKSINLFKSLITNKYYCLTYSMIN